MIDRDAKIQEEALALWLTLFNEPPIVMADGWQMIDAVVQSLPDPDKAQTPPRADA